MGESGCWASFSEGVGGDASSLSGLSVCPGLCNWVSGGRSICCLVGAESSDHVYEKSESRIEDVKDSRSVGV